VLFFFIVEGSKVRRTKRKARGAKSNSTIKRGPFYSFSILVKMDGSSLLYFFLAKVEVIS